jgi:tetratricopeptide (TPR) repeat protein
MFQPTFRPFGLVLVIFLSHAVHAQRERDGWTSVQPIEISGHVRIADLGEPARNVSVRLERFSGGIVEQMSTDHQGRFRFAGLQRGYYTVIVEAQGFRVSRQPADLQVLFKAFLVFDLQPDTSFRTAPAIVDLRVPVAARDEYTRALAALEEKKVTEAIPYLQKAISIHPEFYDANLMLGTSLMDLRRWKEAETPLRRALEIKPDSSAAIISLGEVNWRLKRLSEAESLLLRGLKLDDNNWHGHFTLARLYWEKGDALKAGSGVGRTLQLKPAFAEAHLLAGNVLLRLGQEPRAIVEYEEYLKLAPKGEFAPQTLELVRKIKRSLAEQKP